MNGLLLQGAAYRIRVCSRIACALFVAVASCSRDKSPGIPLLDSIVLSRLTQLGASDGQAMVESRFATACIEGEDRYFYVDFFRRNVAMFDGSGELTTTIGRSGNGPGEFGQMFQVLSSFDAVYVVDPSNGRLSAIDSSGIVKRTLPFATSPSIQQGVVVLTSGKVVVSKVAPDPLSGRLYGLHFLGDDGAIRKSFGSRELRGIDLPRAQRVGGRILAASRDGGFWAASFYEHRIEKWSADGVLERVLEPAADWFPGEPDRASDGRPDTGPSGPSVVDIVEGADGLWLLVSVGQAGSASSREDPHRDTLIELLDPASGEILGATRSDARLAHFSCAGRIASAFEVNDVQYVQIWSVALRH